MAFFYGILFGISTILFIGPVFFLLLKSSIDESKEAGFSVALGIIVSDILCLYLCSYFAPFFQKQQNLQIAAVLGSILLLVMGISYIKSKYKVQSKKKFTNRSFMNFFTKGFLINFVNPFVFAVWLGFIIYANKTFSTQYDRVTFHTGILVGIFSTDILKVFLAQPIKTKLTPKLMEKIYKIIGVILLIFSLRMLVFAFFK